MPARAIEDKRGMLRNRGVRLVRLRRPARSLVGSSGFLQ